MENVKILRFMEDGIWSIKFYLHLRRETIVLMGEKQITPESVPKLKEYKSSVLKHNETETG